MYDYRKMTLEERQQTLAERRALSLPLHAPPHWRGVPGEFLITAACYEHRHIFENPNDLSWLAEQTLQALTLAGLSHAAWVFLPNHYHVLLQAQDLSDVSETLRLLHSRIATEINGRQKQRGRQVWYRFTDRLIRNERHYWATVNYIHFNPVKHGYVDQAQNWAWSSVHDYLATQGKEWLERAGKDFPFEDYGKGWDW